MLFFVVAFNFTLSGVIFYLAWKILRLRKTLSNVNKTLLSVDRTLYNALHPTPRYVYLAKGGSANLRDRYRQLQLQLQKIEKFLALLKVILKVWRRIKRG